MGDDAGKQFRFAVRLRYRSRERKSFWIRRKVQLRSSGVCRWVLQRRELLVQRVRWAQLVQRGRLVRTERRAWLVRRVRLVRTVRQAWLVRRVGGAERCDRRGGATGPAGQNGATGVVGATGPAGPNGATGPAGATGAVGSTGAAGAKGATGSNGATGSAGPAGPTGTVTPGGVATAIMTSFNSVGTTGTFAAPISGGAGLATSTGSFVETYKEQPFPASCTMNSLFVKISIGSASAYQLGVTLFKNGVATALTCSAGPTGAVIGNSATCSDTTHTVTVNAGDTLAYLMQPSASNNNHAIAISMHCQ